MFLLANELNDKHGSNLDEEFVANTEKAYEEITEILRKHKLILDWNDGEGIIFRDYNFSKTIDVDISFTKFDIWK